MLQVGKSLKEMSELELKALAYDLLVQREQNLADLQTVNQAIQELRNKAFTAGQPTVTVS
jgi:hypothetical protein